MYSRNFKHFTESCSESFPPFVPLNELNLDWVVEEPSSDESTQPFFGKGLMNVVKPDLFVHSQPVDEPNEDFFSETIARNLATVPDTEDGDPRNAIFYSMKAFIRGSRSVSTYGLACVDRETPDLGFSRLATSSPQGHCLCKVCEVVRDGLSKPDAGKPTSSSVATIVEIFRRRGNIVYNEGSDAARLMAEMVVYDEAAEATNLPTLQVENFFPWSYVARLFTENGYFRSRWVTDSIDDSSPPVWKEYEEMGH